MNYTVSQVAKILGTDPETVRRWIRSGKLKASRRSRKEGNVITDNQLKEFVSDKPKYFATFALTSLLVPLPITSMMIAKEVVDKQFNEQIVISLDSLIEMVEMEKRSIEIRIETLKDKSKKIEEEIANQNDYQDKLDRLLSELDSIER